VPPTDRSLVVDASVVVAACLGRAGFEPLAGHGGILAPCLLWSEAASALRELHHRGEVDEETAAEGLERLLGAPIEPYAGRDLQREATAVAKALGWAKTYDAEYVALARIIGAPLVTIDARLARRAGGLARILGPTEL
jgi:predicted nucleic acid-binding protein